jgi:Ca-activated chloride channel family protein
MHPVAPLDVFAGQDLVVLARYEGSGHANVVVRGRANGRDVRWSTERNFPQEERENAFVPRLWATQRIGWLTTEKRRNGGSSEVDDEIRRLGEKFGIPTEFTSYLVQEPGRVADQTKLRRVTPMVGAASGGAMNAPAAAPQAVFESAKKASAQRDVKSLAAAEAANDDASGEIKHAGSHMFRKDSDRWVDLRMKGDLQVYKVKAYSRSYFALLDKIPELRQAFTAGDKLVVAGKSVAIEIVEDTRELTDSELQTIASKW